MSLVIDKDMKIVENDNDIQWHERQFERKWILLYFDDIFLIFITSLLYY